MYDYDRNYSLLLCNNNNHYATQKEKENCIFATETDAKSMNMFACSIAGSFVSLFLLCKSRQWPNVPKLSNYSSQNCFVGPNSITTSSQKAVQRDLRVLAPTHSAQ